MPRFKNIGEIQKLMGIKELIRNLGIIAHIDHGKTTLADSLLAGSGLLSTQMAGSARVLDYLAEEQRRKITLKTANISLLYKVTDVSYLINLVDTPGHVDFTGKVIRALRAMDGAVVVVDAVEEIMAQTELVTRQALEERVRPVLFVNKVDRLITELHLNEQQIQKKLNQIISNFNNLIELYAEKQFKSLWKVDLSHESVALGSALHGWGFTLGMAREEGIKFSDIVVAYRKGEYEKLRKIVPVHSAVFGMVVANVPNPKVAQSYRVEKIWRGDLKSEIGKTLVACSDEGPTIVCVTNVQSEQNSHLIATARVFSGTVKKGDILHRVDALSDIVIDQVYVCMGSLREEVSKVSAGNIAAFVVSTPLKAGETLVDLEYKASVVPFEGVSYVSESVVTVAVEPKNPKDIPLLLESLDKLAVEDPNLIIAVDEETGEYLLSGMGELHLEVALNQLKSVISGVELVVSSPRVVYRESVTGKGSKATALSPNRKSRFTVLVEPLAEDSTKIETKGQVRRIISFDKHQNVLCDCSGKTKELSQELLESVISGFEFACRAGPICGEPIRKLRVNLVDFELSHDLTLCGSIEVMRSVGKAVFGSFLTAKPVLMEPVYRANISVPAELVGECQRIITTRRGKVSFFEDKGLLSSITCYIPVAESFGLSKELRTSTSGRAFWQSSLDRWERVPDRLAPKVVAEVRRRKGLASKIPEASMFVEEGRR